MRAFFANLALALCLLVSDGSPLYAQDNKKKEEPNVAVHYTLAAIGAIIIMVLVCMPARRD